MKARDEDGEALKMAQVIEHVWLGRATKQNQSSSCRDSLDRSSDSQIVNHNVFLFYVWFCGPFKAFVLGLSNVF